MENLDVRGPESIISLYFPSQQGIGGFRDGFAPDCLLQRGVRCEPVSGGNSPSYVEKPRFSAGVRAGASGAAGRDAPDAATSGRRAVISLSGHIPVPHRQCCGQPNEGGLKPARTGATMLFTFPEDAGWKAERHAPCGVEIGEYCGVVRVHRRVF